ncbi:MAG: hypothetical protein ABIO72_04415 [Patescibacteria group bacterium]
MPSEYPATPGLDEARQGRPWWKACCVGCFFFLLVMIIGFVLFWRGLGGGRGPQVLSSLPSNFPPALTLYRMDKAASITYFSGEEKQRTISALLSPVRWLKGDRSVAPSTTSTVTVGQALDAQGSLIAQVDTVSVVWQNLDVPRIDLLEFYQDEFRRNGFTVQSSHDDVTQTDSIVATRNDIMLALKIQDLADIEGIDTITAVVDYLN